MVAERKMSLAEEVLSAFYQAKDIIRAARSPGSFGGEGHSWRKGTDVREASPELGRVDAYFAPAERLNKRTEFFSRFDALEYRSQAVFGVPVGDHFYAIREARYRVQDSSVMLAECARQALDGAKPLDPKTKKDWESDIWWRTKDKEIEPDAISQKVAAAVKGIESVCRPALDESLSLWPWKWPKSFWSH